METKRSIALAEPSKEAPELRRLGIPNAELAVLARQGRLQFDQRARAKSGYWRLRFRFQGRTRTVYLGTNTVLISAVRRELQVLRAPRLAKGKVIDYRLKAARVADRRGRGRC